MSTVCNLSSPKREVARRCVYRRAIFFAIMIYFALAGRLWADAGSVDGPSIYQPSTNDEIIFRVSSSSAVIFSGATVKTPEQHLKAAKQALVLFRETANPRFLGDAERELAAIPNHKQSAPFYFYRASLRQSLHLFDEALADLNKISAMKADNLESRMMRFTISFVSGNYQAAEQACSSLKQYENSLYAASCVQQLQAVSGDADAAYQALKQAMAAVGVLADRQALIWASGTLADIAERAGRDDALALWQLALQLNRGDLYTRARLASLLLNQGDYQQVMSLTEDYLAVDALAVSRAIAQQYLGGNEALVRILRERFDEARWRGEILHKRAYAQFLLEIEQQPQLALLMAEKNWEHQREWPDAVILSHAKDAANAVQVR
jgi:tetratricopeptide (TPR) repeat protein